MAKKLEGWPSTVAVSVRAAVSSMQPQRTACGHLPCPAKEAAKMGMGLEMAEKGKAGEEVCCECCECCWSGRAVTLGVCLSPLAAQAVQTLVRALGSLPSGLHLIPSEDPGAGLLDDAYMIDGSGGSGPLGFRLSRKTDCA